MYDHGQIKGNQRPEQEQSRPRHRTPAAILGLILLLTTACSPDDLAQDGPQRHLLLITLDTTRADRLGCYGYEKPTSPNLDAFAREAVLFETAIAQAAVTPVSHASIFTGLDPHRHGLRVLHGLEGNHLPADRTTLAEVWEKAGGKAAAFISAFPVTAAFGLDQGFGLFDDAFPLSDGDGVVSAQGAVNTESSQRRADQTTQAALDWLEARGEAEPPLFMWVHYFDPHDTHLLPPRHILSQFRTVSQRKEDTLRAYYDAEVFYMDLQIGRLLNAFKEQGLWDDLVVAVVADHGEGLGDHDWWSHGILYQEQIRVPLMVRVPGTGAGKRVDSLVRTIDLMPTLLEATGIPRELYPPMDGASLGPALESGALSDDRLAYSDSINMLSYSRPDVATKRDRKDDKLYCLMSKTHKLIVHQLRPDNTEFYDLVNDPLELNDLAAEKPAAMQELMKRLHAMDPFSSIITGKESTDPERLKRLEELGYNK